jgi:glycosyltransferase involved in cell wall biosynthesis
MDNQHPPPILSIVIPCYNQGMYLKDALDGLKAFDKGRIEVIIVNDGSADEFTNRYLRELANGGWHVIFQDNQGLGAARNRGIRAASGKYVLPLDADNKIFPDYVFKGVAAMESDQRVAVVYGNAELFGEKTGMLKPGPFNLQKLMLGNFIDACAVVRKSAIEKVGYYENMKIMGYEDWDLWLRIAFGGYTFHYIDETLFSYRVHRRSMMNSLNRNIRKQNQIEEYFEEKYRDLLSFPIVQNYFIGRIKRHPFTFLYRLILQKLFPGVYSRRIKEGRMYNGWLYS